MWPFRKKRYSILDSGVLNGLTDCHCHILPGVDDGVQTLDEALRALQKLQELGVREIWLTPHIMEDIPNTPADLMRRFAMLNENLNEISHLSSLLSPLSNSPKFTLHLAAENMLDNLFMERLANNDLLPYQVEAEVDSSKATDRRDNGNLFTLHPSCVPSAERTLHPSCVPSVASVLRPSALFTLHPLLLVETSYFHPPMGLYDMLEHIRQKGYTPLLAHPERYIYMDGSDYRHLKDMGVLFQLNLLSLTGAYGQDAAVKAHRLLRQRAYSCLGTDLHSLDSFLEYSSEECLTKEDIGLLSHLSSQLDKRA